MFCRSQFMPINSIETDVQENFLRFAIPPKPMSPKTYTESLHQELTPTYLYCKLACGASRHRLAAFIGNYKLTFSYACLFKTSLNPSERSRNSYVLFNTFDSFLDFRLPIQSRTLLLSPRREELWSHLLTQNLPFCALTLHI